MKLPAHGLDSKDLFARLDALQQRDLSWRNGRTYAYVYDAGRELEDVGRRAFGDYMFQNALDPTAFPSLLKLENDLVGITLEHLGGDERSGGTFTSGGTESIMLAVKAARDFARATRPQVTEPELVLPCTGHAAFHKAAAYLGLKVVLTDVDSQTFAADPQAVRAAITPNTILIVGSAPSYAHGVIDPITELGEIALEHGIPLHVDACVGGWLLPYFQRLGAETPAFDLSVPGVTSLSVDLHKYGFAPKGASLVLYADVKLRKFQYFTCTEWTGYSVVNPTVQSSRSGGPLAAAWAVLHRLGDEGFLDLARQVLEGTRRLVEGIEATPGLRVLGRPDFCMVAATSDEVGVYHLVDAMAAKGWYVQPQPPFRNSPASIHLSLTPKNAGQVAPLVDDLRAAVEEVRSLPSGQLAEAVQAQLANLEPSQVAERLPELMAMAGLKGGELPEKMAEVNELLGALPRPLAQVLLNEFVGSLFTPTREPAALVPAGS